MITKDTIKYAVELSRIRLNREEEEELFRQLEEITYFIDKLKEVSVSSVEPTSHILTINNVFRKDEPSESLPIEEVLRNAPQKEKNFFVVPKIIE